MQGRVTQDILQQDFDGKRKPINAFNALPRERIQLMRMAWDFIGSEFGNRHAQYEKFYGGASFLVKMNMYRNYDFDRATALVDKALALVD